MPKKRAEKQMKAIIINEMKGGAAARTTRADYERKKKELESKYRPLTDAELAADLEDTKRRTDLHEQEMKHRQPCWMKDDKGHNVHLGYYDPIVEPNGCDRLKQERWDKWEEKNYPSHKIFRKINNALTGIVDNTIGLAVDKLGLPGFVKDIYETVAPPTSKYYKKEPLMDKVIGKVQEKVGLGLKQDKLYLKLAKRAAKKEGYNPKLLKLAKDKKHKLSYDGVLFGAKGYKDFLLYLIQSKGDKKKIEGAFKKRINYRKRAYDVMKETNDKFSPASLSYYILW